MKKRSREINIFSVSALDLFASAMGAFILMSLIFMVFFMFTSMGAIETKETDEELAASEALAACKVRVAELQDSLAGSVDATALQSCQSRIARLEAALEQCNSQAARSRELAEQLEQADRRLAECRRALEKTFVLVLASWSSGQDVDLHVVDPGGREFFFRNRRVSGSPAALEEDSTRGPGNEVWLHPSADPGRYRICYKLYGGAPVAAVRGSILWQEGKIEIPELELTRHAQMRLAAELLIDNSGRVYLDAARSGEILAGDTCS